MNKLDFIRLRTPHAQNVFGLSSKKKKEIRRPVRYWNSYARGTAYRDDKGWYLDQGQFEKKMMEKGNDNRR